MATDRPVVEAKGGAVSVAPATQQVVEGEGLSAQAAWRVVVEQASRMPPFKWITMLELQSVEGTIYRVAPKPGHREILKFINAGRLEQLGQMIRQASGRAAKVQMDAPAAPQDLAGPGANVQCPGSKVQSPRSNVQGPEGIPGGGASGGSGASGVSGGSGGSGGSRGGEDRRGALSLPLVQQVMQVFDVSVVGIRTEAELAAAAAAAMQGAGEVESGSKPVGNQAMTPGKPLVGPVEPHEDELMGEVDED